MSVAVTTRKAEDDYYKVRSIFIDSSDVLRAENEDYASENPADRMFRQMEKDAFEDLISRQLAVPKRLLHVDYNPTKASKGLIGLPYGWTVQKLQPT